MMKKRKRLVFVLLALVAALSMAACDGPARRNGKTVLKFMHIWPEHAKMMNQIATDFMVENGDIEIDISYVPHGDVDRVLQSAYIGGTVPDVFFQWTHYMYKWVPDDIPMDLTFLYEELKDTYLEEGVAWEAGKVDGKYYNAPFRSTGFLVAYNKTMFENKGWEVPESLQEFETLLSAMKTEVTTPLAVFGGTGGTLEQINTAFGVYRDIMVGAVEDPNYRTGRLRPDLTDDSSAKLLEKLKAWMDRGYFGTGVMGRKREDVMNLFMNGQAPMCLFNNNELGTLAEGMIDGMEIGVFALPSPAGMEFKYVFGGFDGFCISSTTRHKDESVRFVKYLVSDEVQQKWADSEKSIMVNKSVLYKDEAQKHIAGEMKYAGKYDIYADYNAGQYGERNGTLLNDYLAGSYKKSASELIEEMIENTYKGMRDKLLNPPNGLDWIDRSYTPKEYDRSWMSSGPAV